MKGNERRKRIRVITKRIAEQVKPKKIVLFGSFAYGKPDNASDIDLLVICDFPHDKKDDSFIHEVMNHGKVLYDSRIH